MSDTLSLSDAAALLNVGYETLRVLADSGQVAGAKVGQSWVFLREDLLTYLRREVQRQTSERLAKHEAAIVQDEIFCRPKVQTAMSASGVRGRKRQGLPDLTKFEGVGV